ncbi:MAG: metallo-beta-lactamase family protein [Treponematales bacterium]
MRVRFWGVRGGLPAPLTPLQVKSKLSAVLERLTPADLAGPRERERFLACLPPWLFGTAGGNSPCVTVQLDKSPEALVFDAGSGIREMGAALSRGRPRPPAYHLFLSHFHWDHIQGLPFFAPAYDPAVSLDIYSPEPGAEEALSGQMTPPYFPVGLDALRARKTFHLMEETVTAGSAVVSRRKMNHPGNSWAFRVEERKRVFIYATDTELAEADFERNMENAVFFAAADLLVIDAQYTPEEAADKVNWGHNSFRKAVDFAAHWGIRRVALFHHDPAYDDRKLWGILEEARRYAGEHSAAPEVSLAVEGREIML